MEMYISYVQDVLHHEITCLVVFLVPFLEPYFASVGH